ncbi:hypothetical protein F5Y12DRAFT_795169 [Xylaria sp. FL1777]|nr:hypothetical protein F5Y12DRAFT_795169 [Xylaria sp. FL1777]
MTFLAQQPFPKALPILTQFLPVSPSYQQETSPPDLSRDSNFHTRQSIIEGTHEKLPDFHVLTIDSFGSENPRKSEDPTGKIPESKFQNQTRVNRGPSSGNGQNELLKASYGEELPSISGWLLEQWAKLYETQFQQHEEEAPAWNFGQEHFAALETENPTTPEEGPSSHRATPHTTYQAPSIQNTHEECFGTQEQAPPASSLAFIIRAQGTVFSRHPGTRLDCLAMNNQSTPNRPPIRPPIVEEQDQHTRPPDPNTPTNLQSHKRHKPTLVRPPPALILPGRPSARQQPPKMADFSIHGDATSTIRARLEELNRDKKVSTDVLQDLAGCLDKLVDGYRTEQQTKHAAKAKGT